MTWYAHAPTFGDPETFGTSEDFQGIVNNIKSARAGDTGAPYEASAWHPYNGVTIGDGNTGVFYNYATNGVLSTIETPNFVDGYEYRVRFESVGHNSGSSQTVTIDLYAETTAAYLGVADISGARNGTQYIIGYADILEPRKSVINQFGVHYMTTNTGTGTDGVLGYRYFETASPQKILKARLGHSAGSYDHGRLILLKRLCYA